MISNLFGKSNMPKWFFLILVTLTVSYAALRNAQFWVGKDHMLLTGDEPHYLMITKSILLDRDINLKNNYLDEETNIEIIGKTDNWHCITSGDKYFSVHYVGVPLIIYFPYKFWGKHGVKFFLSLLNSISLTLIVYLFIFHISRSILLSTLGGLAIGLGMEFMTAYNMVYPDFIVGIISLLALVVFASKSKSYALFIFLSILVAIIPWVHIRLTPILLIFIAYYIYYVYYEWGNSIFKTSIPILIPILSFLSFLTFNIIVYKSLKGPYSNDGLGLSLELNLIKNLVAFIRLHLDRYQGMFILNPVLLLGVLGLFSFYKKNKPVFIVFVLFYLALIVPNCLHPNWMLDLKGFTYSRYMWAASILWIVPIAYLFNEITLDNRYKNFFVILLLAIISSEIVQYYYYVIQISTPAEVIWREALNKIVRYYPNNFPLFNRQEIDVFYNPFVNIIYLLGLILIISIGYGIANNFRFSKSIIITFLSFSFICGIVFPIDRPYIEDTYSQLNSINKFIAKKSNDYLLYPGDTLSFTSNTGKRIGEWVICEPSVDKAEYAIHGPYRNYPPMDYILEINYELTGTDSPINYYTAFHWGSFRGDEGQLTPGGSISEKRITIPQDKSDMPFQLNVYYNGTGKLILKKVRLIPQGNDTFSQYKEFKSY